MKHIRQMYFLAAIALPLMNGAAGAQVAGSTLIGVAAAELRELAVG